MQEIKDTGIKNAPLRQAYEQEVRDLASYAQTLSEQGMTEEEIANSKSNASRFSNKI